MKIHVFHENNQLSLEIFQNITVSHLKKLLSLEIKNDNDKLILMNEKGILNDDEVVEIKDNHKNFILYRKNDLANKKLKELTHDVELNLIRNLIMNVTGAKNKLELIDIEQKPMSHINNQSDFFVDLSTGEFSFPGISTNSLRVRQDFENFFRPYLLSNHGEYNINEGNLIPRNNVRMNISLSPVSNINEINSIFNGEVSNLNNVLFPQIIIGQQKEYDVEKIKALEELGYPEEIVKKALLLTGNDIEASADLLLSGRIEEFGNISNILPTTSSISYDKNSGLRNNQNVNTDN